MAKRRRCRICGRLFTPDPRVKQRQGTCGERACQKEHKRQSNQSWRRDHPDYFLGTYAQQKEVYGTRADYKKHYRQAHPEYVKRNAGYVRAYRQRRRNPPAETVSPTSCDLRLTFGSERTSLSITQVSHTSREIFVSVRQEETSP